MATAEQIAAAIAEYTTNYDLAMQTIRKAKTPEEKERNRRIREARAYVKQAKANYGNSVLRQLTGAPVGNYNPQTRQWTLPSGEVRLKPGATAPLSGVVGPPRPARQPGTTTTPKGGGKTTTRSAPASGSVFTPGVIPGITDIPYKKPPKKGSKAAAKAAREAAGATTATTRQTARGRAATTAAGRAAARSPRSATPPAQAVASGRGSTLRSTVASERRRELRAEVAKAKARQSELESLMEFGWNPMKTAGSKAKPLSQPARQAQKKKKSKGRG